MASSGTQSCISLAPRAPLQIAPQVVIGTVDVAAIGARVLLSLQPPSGWTVSETGVDLVGLLQPGDASGLRPVLTAAAVAAASTGAAAEKQPSSSGSGGDGAAPLLVVRNMVPPGSATPAVSLVVLNAALPEGDQAEVAAALVDLITLGGSSSGSSSGSSTAPNVVVAAAMLLQQLSKPAPLYQHLLNGAKPLGGAAAAAAQPLPTTGAGATAGAAAVATAGGLRVRDGQLAALLHVLAVGGEAAACLVVPGTKPAASSPLDLPDAVSACDTLGVALAAATGLSYAPGACRAVTASYKWFVPERMAGSDVMYT